MIAISQNYDVDRDEAWQAEEVSVARLRAAAADDPILREFEQPCACGCDFGDHLLEEPHECEGCGCTFFYPATRPRSAKR